MASAQWARVRIGVDCGLRHGAWYGVKRLTPLEAVLDVGQKMVSVPRSSLQLVPGGVFEIGWGDELY